MELADDIEGTGEATISLPWSIILSIPLSIGLIFTVSGLFAGGDAILFRPKTGIPPADFIALALSSADAS